MTTGTLLLAAILYGADAKLDAEIQYTFTNGKWDAKKFKTETTGGAAAPKADPRGVRMAVSGKAGTPASSSLMLPTGIQGDFIVTAAFELLDRLIGRGGRTVRALRTVARAAAGSGERVTLEIRDAE